MVHVRMVADEALPEGHDYAVARIGGGQVVAFVRWSVALDPLRPLLAAAERRLLNQAPSAFLTASS